MDPKVWGPHGWMYIHSIPLGYPDNPTPQDMINIYTFFNNFHYSLPCASCRNNYQAHLKVCPLDTKALSSRAELFNWTVDIHNEVNKMLHKPVLTHQQAYDRLVQRYQPVATNRKRLFWCLLIVVVIVGLLMNYNTDSK